MNAHAHGGSNGSPYPREEEEEGQHRHQPYSDIMSTLPRGESLMRCYRYNSTSASEQASCNRAKADAKGKSAKKSQYVLHSYHEVGDGNSNNSSRSSGDLDAEEEDAIPDFQSLVNFPYHVTRRSGRGGGGADGGSPSNATFRRCVMCGEARKASHGAGSKKSLKKEEKNDTTTTPNKDSKAISSPSASSPGQPCSRHIIPKQNKGLCTACDVAVWVVAKSAIKIKWCKGCKNFKLWKQFGEKTMATKCAKCREKQREKYAKKVGRDLVGNTNHQGVVGDYSSPIARTGRVAAVSSTHIGSSGAVGSRNGSSKGSDNMSVRRTSSSGKSGNVVGHGGLSFLIAATNQVE